MRRTALLVLLLIVMASAGAGSAQVPSFSSRVESVRVDVLVTENGKPVLGLRPADFDLRDNGIPQQIDLASYEEIPLNVILALDMSGSLDAKALGHLRDAGKMLLSGLNVTDQSALITFNEAVSQRTGLTPDIGRVRAALGDVVPSGQTSLVDASFTGMMAGESDAGRSLLIVFSDGVDTTSYVSFLKDLSAATGGRTIEVESTRDLNAAFGAILAEFRQRYLISYSPQGVAAAGWHRLEVRVKGRNVRARPGYFSSANPQSPVPNP